MLSLWRALISFLVWLSADPAAITAEHPKAAAAVAVAYAAFAPEPEPITPPKPVGPVNSKPATTPGPCPGGVCPIR